MTRRIEKFDAIRNEVLWTEIFQCGPIIFERNELLHEMLPWRRAL